MIRDEGKSDFQKKASRPAGWHEVGKGLVF